MANEPMQMSAAGLAALREREHAVLRYHNDVANNCTYGVGTLAHRGPCTADESQRPVTIADVNTQLQARVGTAVRAVRERVHTRSLTQDQFDALVSFTFHTGAIGRDMSWTPRKPAPMPRSLAACRRTCSCMSATPMVVCQPCESQAWPVGVARRCCPSRRRQPSTFCCKGHESGPDGPVDRVGGNGPGREHVRIRDSADRRRCPGGVDHAKRSLGNRHEGHAGPLRRDATQHHFCAQRDELVADRKLQRVIADKKAQAPACTAVIDARVAAWQKKRDVSCDRSAARDFGGGSMESGARLLCRTANTTDYTSKLASERVRCRNR